MSATLRPISLIPTTPARTALAVRWDISPAALLASPAASLVAPHNAAIKSVALVCHIRHSTASAELALELHSGERTSIALADGRAVERTELARIDHIDAPGLLILALRDDRILYARTPLLAQTLALPGGTYDAPAAFLP